MTDEQLARGNEIQQAIRQLKVCQELVEGNIRDQHTIILRSYQPGTGDAELSDPVFNASLLADLKTRIAELESEFKNL
jgi:hypothetical protein